MTRPKLKNLRIGRRPVGLALASALLLGGVAFALLQSQAKLTGNTIRTGSAGLLIGRTDTSYGTSTSGYDFSGIIPGAITSQTEHFLLKNGGTSQLALKVAANGTLANPAAVDLSKVNVIITPYDTATSAPGTSQSFPLQSLIDSAPTGGLSLDYPAALAPGQSDKFDIKVAMDGDAVSGSGASLSDVDLEFNGVAQSSVN